MTTLLKPLRLGLATRPFERFGQARLAVTVFAWASIDEQPLFHQEAQLWEAAADLAQPLDLLLPKQHAEFFVAGWAHTDHQDDKTACAVSVTVGDLRKRLTVFGDRFWIGRRPSDPQAFDRLPLIDALAYGGPDYPDNPHGRGRALEEVNGVRAQRLPNLELAHELVASPTQAPSAVARFGPEDLATPQRQRGSGTHDETWLKTRFPGFADDIDWRIFNLAPRDQQWPGRSTLPTGVSCEFVNLHPEKPWLRGQVPQVLARCFMQRRAADGSARFEELPLRLTTAWFFPHLERMGLVFHGDVGLPTGEASEVEVLMPALESIGQPRPMAHYEQVMTWRLSGEEGDLHTFRDEDLLPEALLGGLDDELLAELPGELAQERARQRVQQALADQLDSIRIPGMRQELETAFQTPKEWPQLKRLSDLPHFTREVDRQVQAAQQQAQSRLAELQGMRDLKSPPAWAAAMAVPDWRSFELPDLMAPPSTAAARLPAVPPFDLKGMRERLAGAMGEAAARPALHAGIHEAEFQAWVTRAYRDAVQHCGAAPRLDEPAAAALRAQVVALHAAGEDLAQLDLTGADLSGLDLTRARLAGATLESANLDGTVLDEADLTEAVLARASLGRASLRGALCQGANLSLAQLSDADLSHADLDDTQWHDSLVIDCRFDEASLCRSEWKGAGLKSSRVAGAVLDGSDWKDCLLSGVDFHGSTFESVDAYNCGLAGCDFSDARLNNCQFVDCQLDESRFARAWLGDCLFALEASLRDTDFSAATLHECNLRGMPLTRACFENALLEGSDFSNADLTGAAFTAARARGVRFHGSNLSAAVMRQANLMEADLQKSTLIATDLRDANLFQANLAQAWLDASTLLEGAYSERVQLYPRRREVQT